MVESKLTPQKITLKYYKYNRLTGSVSIVLTWEIKASEEKAKNNTKLNTLKTVCVEIAGMRITKNETNIE